MDDDIHTTWERFLTPDILRNNLISASIYVTGFEILVDSITERVKRFYYPRFDESNQINPKYKIDVLRKNKSVTYALLQWLKESDAINDEDIVKFTRVKELRNLITHEMPKMLVDGLPSDMNERLNDMVSLLDKIEKWWITNVEIPINPDFDDMSVDVKDIIPGRIVSLNILFDVALGSDEKARIYINELKKIV